MSDLISRQDAIDAVHYYIESGYKCDIFQELKEIPSAAPERKKGEWVRRKDEDCWECSECHSVLENSDIGNHNFYYCYHCGANMMDICGYMDLE